MPCSNTPQDVRPAFVVSRDGIGQPFNTENKLRWRAGAVWRCIQHINNEYLALNWRTASNDKSASFNSRISRYIINNFLMRCIKHPNGPFWQSRNLGKVCFPKRYVLPTYGHLITANQPNRNSALSRKTMNLTVQYNL